METNWLAGGRNPSHSVDPMKTTLDLIKDAWRLWFSPFIKRECRGACRPTAPVGCRKAVIALAGAILLGASGLRADALSDWPQWRGPNGDGGREGGNYPVKWGPDSNLLWKVELPGKGCSTPAVWSHRIYVTAPVGGKDAVLVFDWSGRPFGQTVFGPERQGKNRNGSGSNPSPVTDGRNLYVYFKSGTLAGLSLEGKTLWKVNLQEQFGSDTLYWDLGTSPVLTEKDVVVAVMHNGGSYLVACDKLSGRLHWKADRNYETPVECDHSYATPIVTRRGGREELLVWGAEHLTTHDPADGKLLSSCGDFNPDKKPNWVVVASAVMAGDIAVVPYGRGTRLHGVRLGKPGDALGMQRAWVLPGAGSFVPTPAVYKGLVYFVGDRGQIECVNPEKGEMVWKDALPKTSASYYSSPTVAAGKLYAAREDGAVFVAKVEGGFALLAENDMGEQIIATPVPVANRLLLRGDKHLFCAGIE